MSYDMTKYNNEQWDSFRLLIIEHKKILFKYYFNKRKFVEYLYKQQMNKELNLDNPQTFTEKINHFKVYYKKYHNKNYASLTDKNKVREYVKNKIGEEYLIPQLLCVKKLKYQDIEKLPNSFVIKTNNGSGTNYIVKDKTKEDYNIMCNYMNAFLKIKYQYIWGEYHYEKIKPRIVIDNLLIDKNGNLPDDIKCFCFNNNGIKHKILYQERVIGDERYRIMFDENWNLINMKSSFKMLDIDLKRPKNYKKIIKVIDKLSEDFNFVRVDLFLFNNKIYFGELTFTPTAGYLKFEDNETDLLWGSWIGNNY